MMENEKRLIDANALIAYFKEQCEIASKDSEIESLYTLAALKCCIDYFEHFPTVDAVEVVHGRWELTAHEEYSNCRWNVTAECSKCRHSKGEIYAGFFPGFSKELARMTILNCAKSVKLDNYCPNCGAKMDGGQDDGK
jgi:hypothetical protein